MKLNGKDCRASTKRSKNIYERKRTEERIDPDVIMMLDISRHLAGQANITFPMLADLCSKTK